MRTSGKRPLKLLLAMCISALSFLSAPSYAEPKYERGDCITPVDPSYSWFGKYAIVEAYSAVEGFTGKSYILAFPRGSRSALFSEEVEQYTKKVELSFCSH